MIRALIGAALLLAAQAALAQPAVTLDPARTLAADTGRGLTIEISLDRPVPWRVRLLDGPPRVAVEVQGLTGPLDAQPLVSARAITGARIEAADGGWGRLVIELARPLGIDSSAMSTAEGGALVRLRLGPVDAAAFAAMTETAPPPEPPPPGDPAEADARITVLIDPGHGGRDPGAMAGGIREADLVLDFARALKEALLRSGRFEVALTREDDVAVPLESRVALIAETGADVFVSIHADALAEGAASGASIYLLGPEAEPDATARLIERHGAGEILRGVDLTGQGDEMATLLAGIARRDTVPRSLALARTLADHIRQGTGRLYKRPVQLGDLAVLKSADVPSVLIELGFISSEADAGLLSDPAYRRRLAAAIRDGLIEWELDDAIRSDLRRR